MDTSDMFTWKAIYVLFKNFNELLKHLFYKVLELYYVRSLFE